LDYHPANESIASARHEGRLLHPPIRSLIKALLACLIVGTILTHFGITAESLVREFGLSYERIESLARRCVAWALPNLLLGALVILPVWLLMMLFRPPGSHSSKQPD
jgi:hypothetical protein